MTSSTQEGGLDESDAREFDVVVLGATGVTGRLIAAQLLRVAQRAGRSTPIRSAVAGRSEQRLTQLLQDLGSPRRRSCAWTPPIATRCRRSPRARGCS